MRIQDYESNRTLNDVGLSLTFDEASDLLMTLRRLVETPKVGTIYLSEIANAKLERELTVTLVPELSAVHTA